MLLAVKEYIWSHCVTGTLWQCSTRHFEFNNYYYLPWIIILLDDGNNQDGIVIVVFWGGLFICVLSHWATTYVVAHGRDVSYAGCDRGRRWDIEGDAGGAGCPLLSRQLRAVLRRRIRPRGRIWWVSDCTIVLLSLHSQSWMTIFYIPDPFLTENMATF